MTDTATRMPIKTTRATQRRPEIHGRSRAVERLRTEVDQLFSDFLRGYWHVPFRESVIDVEPYWRGDVTFGATPAVDIVDKDDSYKLIAELPGVKEQDVEIGFADGILTIEGRKEAEPEDEKQMHFLSERRLGAFHRSFRVPDGVDADKIEASLQNGILTVTLPKTLEARRKQRRIAVGSE